MGIQRSILALWFATAACTGVASEDPNVDDEGGNGGSNTGGRNGGGSGSGGTSGSGAGGTPGPVTPGPNGELFDGSKPFHPGPRAFKRLTNEQYLNAVSDILAVSPDLSAELNDDRRLEAFSNDETQSDPSGGMVQAYERAAGTVASAATASAKRAALFNDSACGSKDACLAAFVSEYGRLLFRRPLADAERTPVVEAAKGEMASKGGDFWAGAQLGLEILLQSPAFLYAIDEAATTKADNGFFRRTPAAIAARLAMVLWNSVPDRELLDRVDAGGLDDDQGVLDTARNMIERAPAKFERAGRHFVREWMGYDLAKRASKDPSFGDWNQELATSIVKETDALVDHFVKNDEPLLDLYGADFSFLDDRVKSFYGGGLDSMGEGKFKLPANRRGILSHASFIAAHSAFERHSPTLRGKAVLERYLCGAVGEPPANAPAELPASQTEPETVRERTERYMLGDSNCNFCHDLMDGVGFAFEHFDAIGKYREFEAVEGAPGGKKPVSAKAFVKVLGAQDVDGLPGLAGVLSASPDVEACMVRNVFSWSLGRHDDNPDTKTLADMHREYREGAKSLRDLMVGLVKSGALTYKSEG